MKKVAIIDYGMGNLHSVAKAIEHVGGVRPLICTDEKSIMSAERVVFPGVGAMRDCMAEIRRLGIDDMLRRIVEERPVLAICVGMQALMEHSEENNGVDCIGLFKGNTLRFSDSLLDTNGDHLKVPHMGWNTVRQTREHPLWEGIENNGRFYFVHSYHVAPDSPDDVAGVAPYLDEFPAVIARDNIFAVQFHPEKSQDNGLKLLKNFLSWEGEG